MLAASSALLLAAPAAAAVVREHKVTLDVRPDGVVREHVSVRVRVDNAKDFERWSPYPIYLDAHRRLVRLEAAGTPPAGKPLPVKRKGRDRMGITDAGVLHASQELELVEFPAVPDGSELSLEYEVEERPYFESGVLSLGDEDAVEALRVELRGPHIAARLVDAPSTLQLTSGIDSAIVTGTLAASAELERAPSTAGPTLRYSWGAPKDWAAVGSWYGRLVADVPRSSSAVRETARRLTAGTADRRETVERLLAFVRRDVRYVAVEIGVGGYRPSAPEEVLTRRWGDCKDKAELLLDLLAAVGVDGRLVLVRADENGEIDAAFPGPEQFNHAIAAIPAATLTPPAGAPVAGGWLFLDATQPTGGLAWLSPAVAGQQALVVGLGGGELVTIPLSPPSESEKLAIELAVAGDGSATGKARLELAGAQAAALAREMRSTQDATVIAGAGDLLRSRVPGGAVAKVEAWSADEGLPSGRVSGNLTLPALLGGAGDDASLLLPSAPAWPSAGITEERTVPVLLSPGVVDVEWRLTLPRAGCRLEPAAVAVDNDLGSFHQDAKLEGALLTVHRRSELRARQARAEKFPALSALSTAERRALKRRLRLSCGAG